MPFSVPIALAGLTGQLVRFLDIEEFELLAEEQEEEESGVAEETAASSLIGGSGSSSATRPALITSTNTQVEEQLRREAEQGQDGSGGLSIVPTSDNQHGKALYDVPAGQQKDNKKDEENYDDIADSILGSVSFKSTVPGTVEFIHSEKQVAAVAAITEPGVSADLPSQRAKPSQVKPVALSALGKRFLDSRSLPESSVSTQSSEEPMTKKSRTESIDDDFTTPIKPKAAAHPALIPTPAAKLNLPPHLAPRTPTGFSSASALHEQYQQITSPSFATPSRSSNIWNQLRPCRLADLPSRPHGSKVDILAIIYSIDSTLITRNKSIKRDCRLVDPSSPPLVPPPTQPHLKKPHHNELKPTVLSIWVKPQSFCPKPGTLVAFRGLTVHRYAGRSLNAFSDVAGSVWYLANPGEEIDGAEEVEEWWTDRCMRIVAEEAEREAEREMLEKQKDSGEGRKPAVEFEV